MIEKISAVTLRVTNMRNSVRFYRDVLGMELLYGGEDAYFSSLCMKNETSAFLNLEKGNPATQWGRLIFHVTDVDAFWAHLRERVFIRRLPVMLHGASDIFTCPIRMAMSCRLRVRSSSLLESARTHLP